MSSLNSSANFEGYPFSELVPSSVETLSCQVGQPFDFSAHLEPLARFLAQAWKDDHPDVIAESEDDLKQCLWAVTAELAIAAKAVGGPVGLEILTGGGSAAAYAVCKQVLSGNC